MASVKGISAYSRTEACIATDDGRTGILMNLVYQGDAKPAYFTRASAITQLHETH